MPKFNSWEILGGRVLGPGPFLISGIVNVTPDSFYDGGKHCNPDSALKHAMLLHSQGADVLDVGGESTRPGAALVSAGQELGRVLPVVSGIRDRLGDAAVVSVDTNKARVAAESIQAGAQIINDVSACQFDPGLADVLAQYKPGYVLMHSPGKPETMQKSPKYENVVEELLIFFRNRMNMLIKIGLPESRIIIDPGIGFGKLLEHNLAILRNIHRFYELGRPLYMGLSNKSLWRDLLGLATGDRQNATQAATALMAAKGVFMHRVHDVELTRQTLTVAENILLFDSV